MGTIQSSTGKPKFSKTPGLEHFQQHGIHSFSGQLVPAPHHPQCNKILPYVQPTPPLFPFKKCNGPIYPTVSICEGPVQLPHHVKALKIKIFNATVPRSHFSFRIKHAQLCLRPGSPSSSATRFPIKSFTKLKALLSDIQNNI